MWKWVYPFLHRHRLSIRRRTRVAQKLSGHLQEVRHEFVAAINERFEPGGTLEGTPASLRVNMDETAVFFEMTSDTTINAVNARTVSIRGTGSNSRRLTACVTCAQDGTKLPLFVVFKAKPGATIEQSLDKLLPPGVFGCCQENGWMDERGCELWFEKVWKPYASAHPSSLLMLDEFKCHVQASFIKRLNSIGTELEVIPGGYTCVLQPCDVGINKPLKDCIRQQYNAWAIRKMDALSGDAKVPAPDRTDIIEWLVTAWSSIPCDSIVRTFASIGYGVKSNNQQADFSPEVAPVAQAAPAAQDEDEDHEIDLIDLVLTVRL